MDTLSSFWREYAFLVLILEEHLLGESMRSLFPQLNVLDESSGAILVVAFECLIFLTRGCAGELGLQAECIIWMLHWLLQREISGID